MQIPNGYRVAFANVHLGVERELDCWAVRICDLSEKTILYQTKTSTALEAKIEAVNFALINLFGPGHSKDARSLSETLAWEPSA